MTLPFVSIVTPTRDRPRFLAQCAKYVCRQTYPADRFEWVVVNCGEPMTAPVDLQQTRFFQWLNIVGCLGHLRNLGNRAARGSILVHFDDDDWHAPDRLETQVAWLMRPGIELVCSDDYFVHFGRALVRKSWTWGTDRIASGGSFAYWRKTWDRAPFAALQLGEDGAFAQGIRQRGAARNLRDPRLFAYIRHDANTCAAMPSDATDANPEDYDRFRELLGADLAFYE